MKFLSRLDDFESIIVDGNVQSSGLSSLYIKDSTNAILRIGNTTGDSFITYDGSELSISSDLDLRLTTPTDQDVFLITSSGNIVTTQGGGTFTVGGGLTLENFGAGYLKTDANGVVSIDTDIIEDTLDSVTDRNAVTTNAITVGGLTVNSDGHQITVAQSDGSLVGRLSYTGTTLRIQGNDGIRFEDTNGSTIHGIITDAGLWGIGTTSPSFKLDVNGTGLFRDHLRIVDNKQLLMGSGDVFQIGHKATYSQIATYEGSLFIDNNDADKDIIFRTDDGSGGLAEYFRLDGSTTNAYFINPGNVGIGTDSPGYKLDVDGDVQINETLIAKSGVDLVLQARASQAVGINSNGTRTMTLDASNNVGIGTTSPAARMHVVGTESRFGGVASGFISVYNANGRSGYIQANQATDLRIASDSDPMTLYVNGSERMRITSSGNVGIGTTAPNAILDVNKSTIGEYAYLGSGNIRQLRFSSYDTASEHAGHQINASSGNGELKLATNSIAAITIDNSQNVGIGTGPEARLHIAGGHLLLNNGIEIRSKDTGGNVRTIARVNGSTNDLEYGWSGAGAVKFMGGGAYTERMRIHTDGNVGIGTTSPGAKLDVSGNIRTSTYYNFNGNPANPSDATASVYDQSGVGVTLSGLNVTFRAGVTPAEVMRIASDGNVGIGTTSPDDRLDVTDGNSQMVFGGASSDRAYLQLKHNAVPADGEELTILDFAGYNDASETTRYVILKAKAEDVTDGTEDGSLTFETMTGGTATQTLTMRSSNVGIGTANPAQKLDVVGKMKISDDIILAQTNGRIDYDNGVSTGALRFWSTNGGAERMRISSAGNLGIGNTNPSQKLDVDGNINSTGWIAAGNYVATPLFYNSGNHNTLNKAGNGWISWATRDTTNAETVINLSSIGTLSSSGTVTLSNYGAGLLQTNASGVVSVDTTSYSTFSGDYGDLTNTPTIPVSGTDFDPVGTDNSTNVTLAGSYDYLTLSGQEITLGQVDYSTDISNTPTIPVSGTDFDPVGTDNSTNVTLAGSYDYLTLSGQEITLGQVDYDTDITNLPTLGTAASSAATDFVAVTGDTMTGGLNIEVSTSNTQLKLKRTTSATGEFNIYTNTDSLFFHNVGQSTYPMMINSSGNVGIGTTSPFGKLNVSRPGINEGYISFDDQANNAHLVLAGTDAFVRMQLGTYNNGSYGAWIQASYDNGGVNYGTEPLILNPQGGYVGIGTTSPTGELHIYGSQPAFRIQSSVSGNMQFGQWDTTTNRIQSTGRNFYLVGTDAYDTIFATSSLERMRITAGGNVGIGTTSPRSGEGTPLTLESSTGYVGITLNGTGSYANVWQLYASGDAAGLDFFGIYDRTAGTYRLVTTNSGNVGIGTTSPGAKLHVDNSSADAVIRLSKGSSTIGNIDFVNEGNRFSIQDDGSRRLVIDTDGNVGIGTTSPYGKLNIIPSSNPTTPTDANQLTIGESSSNSFYNLRIGYFLSGGVYKSSIQSIAGGTGNTLVLNGDGGNVGIGTTNPGVKLDVAGDVRTSTRYLLNTGTANEDGAIGFWDGSNFRIESGSAKPMLITSYQGNVNIGMSGGTTMNITSSSANVTGVISYGNASASRGALSYGTSGLITLEAVSTNTDIAIIPSGTGNVGIGTTNPTYKLQVVGNIDATGVLSETFWTNDSIRKLLANASLKFRTAAGPIEMILDGSGNLGIGTDSPSAKLHVAGSVRVTGDRIDVDSNVKITGQYYGNSGTEYTYLQMYNGSDASINIGTKHQLSYISFESGNGAYTERMRITNTGNVGIGTTGPGHALDVNGNIRVQGGDRKLVFNNGLVEASLDQVTGASAGLFTIANVGVGTTTPSTKLHVVGTAETRLRVGSSNASSNVVLELRDENSPTGQGTVITYNNATGETYFNNALSSATTDFHFQSGEYGSASDFFTLSNSGGNSIVHLSTTTGDSFITYEDSTNELAIASDGDLRLTTPTDQDVFFISSGGNIDMTQAGGNVDMGGQLTVDGNGIFNSNVGIGTASPASVLHIKTQSDTALNQGFVIERSANTDRGYINYQGGAFRIVATDGDPIKLGQVSNPDRVTILNDGNVGIGLTNPGVALDVSGTIRASGDVIAYYTSDQRLKLNIKPIASATEKVKKLGGYEFDWDETKQEIYKGHDYGVMAQEVEAVLPELVTTKEDGYKAVKYEKIIALLIESNKELSARIEELENKINGTAK